MMTRMDCLQFAYDMIMTNNNNSHVDLDELIKLSEKIYRYVNAIDPVNV